MITILIEEEPTEELLRAEVMTITVAIITRLDSDELFEHNTIPVMAITIFGRMKARVIEAHSSQQALVIKKTQLFDFLTDDAGNKNMDILLGFMCADLVGETQKPNVPIKILQSAPKAGRLQRTKSRGFKKMLSKLHLTSSPKAGPDHPEEVSN